MKTIPKSRVLTFVGVIICLCLGVFLATVDEPQKLFAGVAPQTTTCPDPAGAPTLNLPVHRAHTTDTTPTFTWSTVTGTLSYRLMVYTEDRSFEFKKRRVGETNTSYTLTSAEALVPTSKYLWRVRTQDLDCGTWSAWSGRNTLFVD